MENGNMNGRRKACARCQVLKKKCKADCKWAPYFPAGASKRENEHQRERFTIFRRFFSAEMVMESLQELPEEDQRQEAISSRVYEARARERDPVSGCLGEITTLRRQLDDKITEVELLKSLAQG